jgi:hypothetical protein
VEIYVPDLCGIAVSEALTAGRKSMDLFDVTVVAVITAIGGGTGQDVPGLTAIRLALRVPPFPPKDGRGSSSKSPSRKAIILSL